MKTKHGLLLIGSTLLVLCAFVGTISAATIYVPDDYSTIQQAVNAASPGDTIIVRDGSYTENVDVNKQLTIQSEHGSASTIVQANNSNDHVFEVTVDWVNISGFTVQGATGLGKAGIYLETGVDHCTISGNNASNNEYDIHLSFLCNYNTITNNIAWLFMYGLCNYNTITNNTASNAPYGIYLGSRSNNNI
jgi:hypothetical protein